MKLLVSSLIPVHTAVKASVDSTSEVEAMRHFNLSAWIVEERLRDTF